MLDMADLNGKLAVVSGSTAGIGHAIAEASARDGAQVVVNGRTAARVDAAVGRIRERVKGAQVSGVAADLSSASGVETFLSHVPLADVLVNNLGVFEPVPLEQITDEKWHAIFEANVMSGVRLTRAYLPGMRKVNSGRVMFISSDRGVGGRADDVRGRRRIRVAARRRRGPIDLITGDVSLCI
jgi:NAD(P)-dependent dehydrogenase (short-subunit alcohol dehydrogenase family)